MLQVFNHRHLLEFISMTIKAKDNGDILNTDTIRFELRLDDNQWQMDTSILVSSCRHFVLLVNSCQYK